jgi:hypothetical protein
MFDPFEAMQINLSPGPAIALNQPEPGMKPSRLTQQGINQLSNDDQDACQCRKITIH